MGRKRQHDRHLPQRVYLRGQQYVYLPPGQTRYIALGRAFGEAMAAYGQLMQGATARPPRTVGDCMDDYLQSPRFGRLAPRTQADYQRDISRLRKIFGHMIPADIAPSDLYAYAHKRPVTRARLELAAMSNVMHAAIRAGLIDRNPCESVQHEPVPRRDRVPSVDELAAFCESVPDQIALYVRLKLATGLRQGDMLRLDRRMINAEGLTVQTGKTGRTMTFLFAAADGASTGLRELLDAILAMRRRVTALALFATRDGQHYTGDGWKSIWQRHMRAYVDGGGVHFREHDIRAAAGMAKDARDGRQAAKDLLGHRLESTTAGYVERRRVVKITPNK